MDNTFKPGQLINTYDGIAEVIIVSDYYVEEFSQEENSDKVNGDYFRGICAYKILCDYDGGFRKRDRVKSCRLDMCSILSEETSAMISRLKKESPEEFKRFESYKIKKKLGDKVDLWLNIPVEHVDNVVKGFENVARSVGENFTFDEFTNLLKINGVDDVLKTMHHSDIGVRKNCIIDLFNEGFIVRDKQTVFTEFKYTIR